MPLNMNSNIIMAGQQPNVVNTLARSSQAAGLTNRVQRDNQLNQLYQQQGAGILSGDQNALNALAAQDPRQALQFQQAHQQNARQDEALAMQRKRFDLALADFARKASAEEKAAAAAELERDITRAGTFYQAGDLDGLNRALVAAGEEPVQSLDQFPHIAGMYGDALSTLKDATALSAGPKPADEYGRYAAEERAAGREPMSRIEFKRAGKLKQQIEVTPDGGVRLTESFGDDPTDKTSPASPAAMISSIDGILNDPALDFATGWLEWTQNIPGTGSKRFGTRAAQLEGQAFLQAFESLKGAGQITEIEGQKATQAIGRLNTAQSAGDYKQALTELRGILQKGMESKANAGKADQPKRMKYNLETGAFE